MGQEKLENKTDKEENSKPKVRIDARVDAEVLDKIEELVKETGDTKSKVINDLLSDKLKSKASSTEELSRLEKELEAKNRQIDSLLRLQEEDKQVIKNNQELELYERKTKFLELENASKTLNAEQAVKEAVDETANDKKDIKRSWFKWFK